MGEKIATLVQSARCPVVSQPKLADCTKVVGGAIEKRIKV